jgi:hypothetical protein
MRRLFLPCACLFIATAFAQLPGVIFNAPSRARQVPLVVSATVEREELLMRPDKVKKSEATPCPSPERKDCYLLDLGDVRARMGGYIYHLTVTETFKHPSNTSAPTEL